MPNLSFAYARSSKNLEGRLNATKLFYDRLRKVEFFLTWLNLPSLSSLQEYRRLGR